MDGCLGTRVGARSEVLPAWHHPGSCRQSRVRCLREERVWARSDTGVRTPGRSPYSTHSLCTHAWLCEVSSTFVRHTTSFGSGFVQLCGALLLLSSSSSSLLLLLLCALLRRSAVRVGKPMATHFGGLLCKVLPSQLAGFLHSMGHLACLVEVLLNE